MPYELDEVINDLIAFAAVHLVPGGRLVYWLPTLTEEYSITDMPQHPRLRLVENCEQVFYNWSRRLITMEKLQADEVDIDFSKLVLTPGTSGGEGVTLASGEGGEAKESNPATGTSTHTPAHAKFRAAYFRIDENYPRKQ